MHKYKNVLLVEDNQPNIVVVSAMLDIFCYDYDVVEDGIAAIKQFNESKYDLILMDLQMPVLDGIHAAQIIRQIEKDRQMVRTPIVALTAHAGKDDKERCLSVGMDAFLPKPFHMDDFNAILVQFVGKNKVDVRPLSRVLRSAPQENRVS